MDAILRIITNSTLLVTKFLRMGLADKNDHPPFFEHNLYEVEVDEDEAINHTILTLNATDFDEVSHLNYDIVDGNEDGTFAVGNFTGDVYLTQPLDYETRKKYHLLLMVSDGRHAGGARVDVKVLDVNDNPPVFDSRLYQATITEEDSRNLPRRIITVKVTDEDTDRPGDVVFSLSGQGVDIGNPRLSHFEIDPSSGDIYVKKPLDRDFPNGHPNWCLTVFAQDEGGTGLVSYSEVVIKLIDINDNAPHFSEELYHGNVTENGTSGLEIITLTANDYDDPNEGSNAQVTYAIEDDYSQPLFTIEPDTGILRTAVCCLDRETQQSHLIHVVATDGGGLRGTASVNISVLDVNDRPPIFTKEEWVAEVNETVDQKLPSEPILTVTVYDEDEKNNFSYMVVKTSGFGSEKFTMKTNKDGSGSLKIIQPLDYEDPEQRDGFTFQIQVSDTDENTGEDRAIEPYHIARAWVKVKLKDVNDNEPQFLESDPKVEVYENVPIGTSLAIIKASDPDMNGMGKVYYSIDKSSDRDRQFFIDNSGTVTLQRPLNRESDPIHRVKILAIDNGMPPKTATATLSIKVKDINDNAPVFLEHYHPIIPENQPPRKVLNILAQDSDDPVMKNGPPFHFRLDPSAPRAVKNSFKVDNVRRGPAAEGMAAVYSLRKFDREVQKEFLVPIILKDSGVPPMIGTSTLTVVIGDENDNKMQSGIKHVIFYSYMGRTHGTQVGRVYIQDLDDWDQSDKTYSWATPPHSNFKLDEDTGMITMKYVLSETSYSLEFHVRDRKHKQSKVKANVEVTVKHIPEKAVRNAGSIRIENLTDIEFINEWDEKLNKSIPSKSSKLRESIAKFFGLRTYSVDIFSIQLVKKRPPVIDVFFSVYDTRYYQPAELNGVLLRNRKEIETEVGINIFLFGIDECLDENAHCDGSCTNKFEVSNSQYLIDANRTSFVGVHVLAIPECVCGARYFSNEASCRPNPCLNGGKCIKENFSVSCECPMGYDGPRCQVLSRAFFGKEFAWFSPLEVCENSHISVEFLSKEDEGLIFYNGPITLPAVNERIRTDFIALELVKGYVRLLIDFGSGTLELKINTTWDFHDGTWHRADIFWNKETVRLDLDLCNELWHRGEERENKDSIDLSNCQAIGIIPPFNEYLNVNTPLQVGGLAHIPLPVGSYPWQHLVQGHHFNGCIRNLMVNSHYYDFANPALHTNTKAGCSYFERACVNNSALEGCGPNGICYGSILKPKCMCKPGWTGTTCDEPSVPAYFENDSYVKYTISFAPNSFTTDIQLKFRTWEEAGEIFRITDHNTKKYSILEIRESRLYFRYNLNALTSEERYVWLSSVIASDGMWHLAMVKRYGATVILTLDGGEGRNYNETSSLSGHMLMDIDKQGLFVGGSVYHSSVDVFTVHNDFRYGCLDDIRLSGKSLPLPPTVSSNEWAQTSAFHNLASECVSPNQCLNISCIAPFICQDLWMKHECRCPEGSFLSKDLHSCLDVDECLSGPCKNDGICHNQEPSYTCHCPHGFQGENCEIVQEFNKFQPNVPAFAATIVCLFILGKNYSDIGDSILVPPT